MNGSGCRDTARALGTSLNTVHPSKKWDRNSWCNTFSLVMDSKVSRAIFLSKSEEKQGNIIDGYLTINHCH
ncbi:MAG: IS1-like element transposase [Plesiomonas shigelloides]